MKKNISLNTFIQINSGLFLLVASAIVVFLVDRYMRQQALIEADSKAYLIIELNTHWFSLRFSAVFLVVLIFVFVLQYWFIKHFVFKPLSMISTEVLKISTDNKYMGEKISIKVPGRELNELIASFNKMSAEIRFHIDNLERQVLERTKELMNINDRLEQDICKRKNVEMTLIQERNFVQSLVETAQVILLVLDTEGRIVRFNPYMEEISGYRLEEVQGKYWVTTFLPERDQDTIRGVFLKAINNIQTKGNINCILTKDGCKREIEWYDKTLRDAEGKVVGLISVGQDVTERKIAEDKIKTALAEKDVLLKELHHRVKNNLQALIYLIEMQFGDFNDSHTKEAVSALQNKIRALALVHEKMYIGKDLSRIDFADYIANISESLLTTFGGGRDIHLQVNSSEHEVDIDVAMPCGLIINELLTNALKHAFSQDNGSEKRIVVEFKAINDDWVLKFSDNGVGIPKSLDWRNSESLGLKLVIAWAEHQLGGTIELDTSVGSMFNIKFPKHRY